MSESPQVDRWDLVDGTELTSESGHRVMIDGMAGPYLRVVDTGSDRPMPAPVWMAIRPTELLEHIRAGRWSVRTGGTS